MVYHHNSRTTDKYTYIMIQTLFFLLFSSIFVDAAYVPVVKRDSGQILSSSILGYTYENMPEYDLQQLAQEQHDRIFNKLWKGNTFQNGPVCGKGARTFNAWDWAVEMQAIADGYSVTHNNTFKTQMLSVFNGMDKYYDKSKAAYHVTTSKSSDIDYDDNAQIATALLAAYNATNDKQYLKRAEQIIKFLMDGWNKQHGGVTWSYGHSYIATISTTEAAISALKLYAVKPDNAYISFAENCLNFLFENLWDESSSLFYDGYDGTDKGKSTDHYTYHEGTALSLASLLYYYTKNETVLEQAKLLSSVSIDRNLGIYNRDTPKQFLRFYKDGANFTQLMVQGLLDYYNLVDSSNTTIKNEVLRSVRYLIDITSNGDGYFGDGNAYQNSEDTTLHWNQAMGESNSWNPDLTQYCDGSTSKTIDFPLLYEASMLRCLWLASTIQQYI